MNAGLPSSGFGSGADDSEIQRIRENNWADQIQNLVSVGIIRDENKKITSINPAATAITGWDLVAAVGKKLADVLNISNGLESTTCVEIHVRDAQLKTKSGQKKLIESRLEPVLVADQIAGYIAIFNDVGKLRMLETEAEKAQRIESLGMMAAGIAHDFNNDLQAVLSSIAAANLTADENIKTLLAIAEKACLHSRRLARQLLTFSRGSVADLSAESIEPVLQDSILLSLAGSKSKLECSIDPDIGPVLMDRSQIEQVFSNLLINADQAVARGGRIFVSAAKSHMPSEFEEIAAKVCIRDEGPGVSEENLQNIFEPYFTTKEHGSGLGLATCQTIVGRHGGVITVDSQPGRGAEFCVYLPLAEHSLLRNPRQQVDAKDFRREKILLLDENPLVLESISELAKVMGHDVESAAILDVALDKISHAVQSGQPFSVAILDLAFDRSFGPGSLGHELKRISPGIHVILVSGYEHDPIMKEFAKYGFDAVLPKPFNRQTLESNLPRRGE